MIIVGVLMFKPGDKVIRIGESLRLLNMYKKEVYTVKNVSNNIITVEECDDIRFIASKFKLVKPKELSHMPEWF